MPPHPLRLQKPQQPISTSILILIINNPRALPHKLLHSLPPHIPPLPTLNRPKHHLLKPSIPSLVRSHIFRLTYAAYSSSSIISSSPFGPLGTSGTEYVWMGWPYTDSQYAAPSSSPSASNRDSRKAVKPKLGGGGGAFSGFNSFLPAPKKTATTASSNASEKKAPARKIFSLKTGAAPGFDREADAEMRNERAFGALGGDGDEDETIPKAGSMRDKELDFGKDSEDQKEEAVPQMKKPEEVKLKGNPMMFKPLSVGRAQQKKRKAVSDLMPAAAAQSTYQPASTTSDNTLSTIADDLNLSKAQRRQLFGRNAPESVAASSRVLHFNTDQEYVTNQELAHTELAAQQHNPVRAIAPGKHTLQQLVNAASTQREALEESFAAGRRNKREAGAKYGW
ncbi:Lysophospholipase catalytic domain family protein [Aspergillus niger]|uniref:Lysophospholipase catalytic domain family protein n=1 Tax=Aspergillus niger TaxID=5061 RepID=A0A505IAU6_ASPNG|nr:Lysophospholipase catalytic domain family protein [Aspergillus niger]